MFDYNDLNLKIGLEIHQQLSNKKLFCNCSTKFQEKNLDSEFSRKLRAVAGEQGYVDVAAAFEEAKHREFVYHGYKDEYCLVDCDDDPPHEINQDALLTALSVAKLFKMNAPDEIQVMRKIIADGSACSSFQRTMLIGLGTKDSFIETTQGNVRITSLCLEEDACKIEKVHDNRIHYSLSRQGIPLLEIRTEPDIKTPEQAKEAAEQIGLLLRSFSSILRGIGTIRQDVNLSIKNGNRIEIKGFQELRMMPKTIDFEISRQINIIKQGKNVEKEVRKANDNGTTSFLRPLPGAARMYPDTDIKTISVNKELLNEVKIPPEDIKTEYSRSSAPGGQNVNKRETAVRLVHLPTNLAVHVESERSQAQNREKAQRMLEAKLYKLLEAERIAKEKGMYISKTTQIEWGNQIRSYVLHPYKMVKDHRTDVEVHDVEKVLNGEIEIFLEAEKDL